MPIVIAGLFFIRAPVWPAVTVIPEIQKIEVKQGDKVKGYVQVKNGFSYPVEIEVQPEDWTEEKRQNSVDWLKVKPQKFILGSGRTKKVKFRAKIPEEARKFYWTQIFFAFRKPVQGRVKVGVRVGSLVYWKIVK